MAIRMNHSTLARWSMAIAAVGGLTLTAVSYLTDDQDADAHATYRTAIIKWGNNPSAANIDQAATYDMAAFSASVWYEGAMNTPEKNHMRNRMVALNHNILIGQYETVMNTNHFQKEGWANYNVARAILVSMRGTSEIAEPFVFSSAELAAYNAARPWPAQSILYPGTWNYDWWVAMSPYLARTNANDPATGLRDTASSYRRNYNINLLAPGAIEAAVGQFATYKRDQHGKDALWVMLDFFTSPYPDFKASQPPAYEANEAGEMDLDQDGVGHSSDVDEWNDLTDAFYELCDQLNAAMPELTLVPNGHDIPLDPALASRVDGWFIEGFPLWHFGSGSASYANALNPDYPHSLWAIRHNYFGARNPVIILDSAFTSVQLWPIAAMFDAYVGYTGTTANGDLPLSPDRNVIGAPTGPVLRDAGTGGIKRQFEDGLLRIYNWTNSSYTYSIDGVVQ